MRRYEHIAERKRRAGQRRGHKAERGDRGLRSRASGVRKFSFPPAKLNEAMIVTTMTMSGAHVDFMPSAIPAMITVAAPVSVCSAIRWVGACSYDV